MSEIASYECMEWELYHNTWKDETEEKIRTYINITSLCIMDRIDVIPKQINYKKIQMDIQGKYDFVTTTGKLGRITTLICLDVL